MNYAIFFRTLLLSFFSFHCFAQNDDYFLIQNNSNSPVVISAVYSANQDEFINLKNKQIQPYSAYRIALSPAYAFVALDLSRVDENNSLNHLCQIVSEQTYSIFGDFYALNYNNKYFCGIAPLSQNHVVSIRKKSLNKNIIRIHLNNTTNNTIQLSTQTVSNIKLKSVLDANEIKIKPHHNTTFQYLENNFLQPSFSEMLIHINFLLEDNEFFSICQLSITHEAQDIFVSSIGNGIIAEDLDYTPPAHSKYERYQCAASHNKNNFFLTVENRPPMSAPRPSNPVLIQGKNNMFPLVQSRFNKGCGTSFSWEKAKRYQPSDSTLYLFRTKNFSTTCFVVQYALRLARAYQYY